MTAHKNVAASVRQRLRNLARQHGEDFQYILVQYGLERLLYRLFRSGARDRFVLKGAALFSLWTDEPHRATRDIDLLGYGDNSIPHLEQVFRQVCEVEVEEDGLVFLTETVRGQVIGRDDEYEGLRMTLTALLDRARIPLQVDIGFGDTVKPEPITVEYPVLLDLPQPVLRAYSREAVVAEKFQAMVSLGMGNSRMKDFFDLWEQQSRGLEEERHHFESTTRFDSQVDNLASFKKWLTRKGMGDGIFEVPLDSTRPQLDNLVFFFGGSSLICSNGEPAGVYFPNLLDRRIEDYNILNLGVMGSGSFTIVANFDKVMQMATPKMVVIYTGHNDYSNINRHVIRPMYSILEGTFFPLLLNSHPRFKGNPNLHLMSCPAKLGHGPMEVS